MQMAHNLLSQWIFQTPQYTDLNWQSAGVIDGILFLSVLILSLMTYIITRNILIKIPSHFIKKTRNTLDDELLKSRIFTWLSLFAPTLMVWRLLPSTIITKNDTALIVAKIIETVAQISIILLVFLSVNSLLNILERIYRRYDISREFPIKSVMQVIKIILILATGIFIISTLVGKPPILIFSGLGAMTAVIMLIFKDSILGLGAGIQLSANRMVARGDWIEMPKFRADGEVLEVALTTVKVRNWDKTITTIPTHALISDSFKNWRGMSQSGVRRIKRSISIDISTIQFLNDKQLEEMKKIQLLKTYISEKEKEISEWNKQLPEDASDNLVNARALTNLGTFRAYIQEYLKNHPSIDDSQTLLVRQLQPTEYGIPIEIYVFTNDNRWIQYESIQSDIFDHLLAILPAFNLRAFQRPSDHAIIKSGINQ